MNIVNVELTKTGSADDTVGVFITIKQKERHDHESILLLLSELEDVVTVEEI